MIDADQHIDYETIVRVITTVAERDMMMMKEEYRKKSGRALENDISEAFVDRQDCLQLILTILNGDIPSLYQYERIRNWATQNGDDYYFLDLALRHLLPREYYLTTVINKYLSKNDLTHATDVICLLHSSAIQQIKGIYPSPFGRELEDDIETFTFGDHRKVYMFCVVLSCYITLMY
ncbi:hypothetical protein TIFTF001_054755 [Ficus carica]|uniref:Uncharacterized protein n=2 Tax=Ficus carica TaxID=3494 RepID=A0AA88EDG3_FICCA|nr:hypothetical protein TIFTF001_054753 [Ficus carica]GMN72590.1 hypothetical protein TIFTF001_054755 [Ficus carica]